MKWTRTPPSKPGFYWIRWDSSDDDPQPVKVYEGHHDTGGLGVEELGIDVYQTIEEYSAWEWLPIPLP